MDDLLIGGDGNSVKEMIRYLKSKYNVSVEGKISRYLGVSVCIGNGLWKLDQESEIELFIKEHQMEKSKRVDRPGDPLI